MPHGLHTSTTTTVALAATAGLLLTACSPGTTDDEVAAPDETVTPSATVTPGASPSETADDDPSAPSPSATPSDEATPIIPTVETPTLDTQCVIEPDQLEQVARIRYAVPSSWKVEGRCDILDPDLEELPDQTEVEAAVFVSTSGVSYREAAAPGGAREVQRVWLGARAGYQASRSTAVSTGEAASPEGQPSTSYLVDLDAGADEHGGVLTLSTGVAEGEGYDLAKAALDAIATTVVVEPPAEDAAADGFAVLRSEGGGTPFSVTYDGACFRLRPGAPADDASDELCDLDPREGAIVTGMLGDDTVVGYAPPLAIAVEGAADTTVNALTASIEGGTVFALRAVDVPRQLVAIGPGGEELVTAEVAAG